VELLELITPLGQELPNNGQSFAVPLLVFLLALAFYVRIPGSALLVELSGQFLVLQAKIDAYVFAE
ncbi:MAG TPA: hypothetical protein VKH46_09150, partial [Thermoanaerobaculia bacterium]|nr:hypothetical protein [Thermoanaerobaculia bacterium]